MIWREEEEEEQQNKLPADILEMDWTAEVERFKRRKTADVMEQDEDSLLAEDRRTRQTGNEMRRR